jgi:hypothetical protein
MRHTGLKGVGVMVFPEESLLSSMKMLEGFFQGKDKDHAAMVWCGSYAGGLVPKANGTERRRCL